jgi:hypothetical protein
MMSDQQAKVPFLATPNGLTTLLVIPMISPVMLPGAGVVASLKLPLMAMWIAYNRPELGQRWYYSPRFRLCCTGA